MKGKKKESEGGMAGVIVAGVLTFILGLVLAGVSLITQPVKELSKPPAEDTFEPGTVFFVRGSKSGHTAWPGKEQAIKGSQLDRLILTESELNQWSDERLQVRKLKIPEEEAGWTDSLQPVISPLNFRILEDQVQVSTKVTFPELLPESQFLYQAKGHFVVTEETIRFVIDSANLGQLPLGIIPGASRWILSQSEKRFAQLEEISWLPEAFKTVESVEISAGQLIVLGKTRG